MALSKYIRDLLFRYECVIIPEFGGLLTKTISAQIDERSHTLSPPSKRLGFNSQLTENDGLLANYVASVDKTPYEKAINFIKFEVKEWQKKLVNQDMVLEEIGTFSLNKEGKILFEPDPNSNFLTDAFGLSTIIAPEVSREDYMEEEVVFDYISDVISDEEIYVNTEVRKRGISPFFKYAASVALLLTIGYIFTKQIIKNNALGKQIAELETDHESVINQRIQEATFEINKTLPAITIKIKSDQETAGVAENNEDLSNQDVADTNIASEIELMDDANNTDENITKEIEEISKTVSRPIEESIYVSSVYRYHVIGGAFRVPANATKKVSQLIAKGYNAQIVGINKWQLTQVAFGSYTTREEAQTALNKIRISEAKDAWMLVK